MMPDEANDQSPPAPDAEPAAPVSMPAVLLPILAAAFNQASADAEDLAYLRNNLRKRCLAAGLRNHKADTGESADANQIMEIRDGVNVIMVRLEELAQTLCLATASPAPGNQLTPDQIAVAGNPAAAWNFISNKLRAVAP